jgi:Tfp pilus assembly PilM family ATPase
MRRRTAGFTLIELVVVLAGVGGLLVASGLIVALRGASLLYIVTMLFPPIGLFLSSRRFRLVFSWALALGVAAFLLTPARWAEVLTLILIGCLGVYALTYPFLVLWAWDFVRRARASRRGTIAEENATATAGSRPRAGLLSRPIVVYPAILVLSYIALTVLSNLLPGWVDWVGTPSRLTGDKGGKSVWSLRIGDYNLAALKLTQDTNGNSVQAEAFDFIEYPKLLTQPDADPLALVHEAIATFLDRNDLREMPVCVVVSDDVARTAVIEAGPGPGEIRSAAEVESRRMIGPAAVAADRLILSYQAQPAQAVGRRGGLVAVCAADREVLRSAVASFLKESVAIEDVHANGFALLNYLRREVLPPAGAHESVVLLEMRSEETNVLITDGQDYWLDRFPIGASHFTRSLMEKLGLTFPKAEHLKRNATKAPDPKAVFTAMRGTYNDSAAKLQESVDRWASKHPGMTIRSVYGIGQGFRLPGLRKFLSQNLKPPGVAEATPGASPNAWQIESVTKFASLSGDEVVTAPQFQENLDDFAALYGSGVQWLGLTDLKTSLGSERAAAAPRRTWSERWDRAWKACLAPDGYVVFNPMALYLALVCVETAWLIGRIRRSRRAGLLAPKQDNA